MTSVRHLGHFLERRAPGPRVTLVNNPADLVAVLRDGPQLVVIATAETLAVIGLQTGGAPEVQGVLDFSDNFTTFSLLQRRWAWTAVLEVQLESLLDSAGADLAHGRSDGVYLYLQTDFVRKHFPFAQRTGTDDGAPPLMTGDVHPESCRRSNHRIDEILATFGAASLQATRLHPTAERDSYHCYAPHNRLLGIGRGASERQMMCGAVFEYCERWIGQARPRECNTASYAMLGDSARHPGQLLGLDAAQCELAVQGFRRDASIDWLPARLESTGARTWVPLSMVHYLLDEGALSSRFRNSNGCALGNSFEEAALFGALEIIERDALLAVWYSASPPPRIEAGTITCDRTSGLLLLLASRGYETLCFDITLDLDVPSVLVLLSGSGPGKLAGFVTAASHPNAAVALRSALAEAQSLIGSAEQNLARYQLQARHDATRMTRLRNDNQALYYGQAGQRHHFTGLYEGQLRLSYAAFLARHPGAEREPARAYRQLCERVASAGYELVSVDNTPPVFQPLGLASARVFIPGTIPLAFGDHAPVIPRGRLERAARRADWIRADADMANAPLHPLG